ncbi:MAG: RNA binding S1 domain protein [Parcubacteria group bacterium GW2011_GWA1_48_11b]|nr:MAG: RNA binding S1 domain protein [Parcubacteria group bacterium GW2011_GWA1_48_11b]
MRGIFEFVQQTLDSQSAEQLRPYRLGDIVEGTVVGIGRSSLFLDLSPQGTGIIWGREFLEEKDGLRNIKIGEQLKAKIVDLENDEGYIELSVGEAGRELTWGQLKAKKDAQEAVNVVITGANKGGLLCEVVNVPAFLPVSQLSQEHYPRVEDGDPAKILLALQKFVGETLEVRILDINPREGKVILSEKAKDQAKVRELLLQYQIGQEVEGEITGVVDFGAFLRFGPKGQELEGLIHISEIDWQIIDDPNQVLKVGDPVKAKIIDIAQGRVSLSLKALKQDPWKEVEKKYKKGDMVQGRVTRLNTFGAFVEIEPMIQGLTHISEFGTKKNMEEQIEAGKTYSFQILELNVQDHRMSLRVSASAKSQQELPQEQPQQQEQSEKATE